MKSFLDSLPNKCVCSFLFIMVIFLGTGCSVALKHQSLSPPLEHYSEKIGTSSAAEGINGKVGWGRFTVFYIPIVPVYISGDGNVVIMELIQDALKQVGYDIIGVLSTRSPKVPFLKCRVERFWFNNFTWTFPYVPTWGRIQLAINLVSPEGKVLWSKNFAGEGSSANFFNGYTSAANKSMKKILNEMVKVFSSEEFHSVLVNYSPESQDEKSIESLEGLEKDSESQAEKPTEPLEGLEKELKKLEELKAEKLLTEEEYLKLRKKIINKY